MANHSKRYLKAAGLAVRPAGRWGHPPKPAKEVSTRKLPRQVDTPRVDPKGESGLGRNVSGGTRPRLSWGRSVL